MRHAPLAAHTHKQTQQLTQHYKPNMQLTNFHIALPEAYYCPITQEVMKDPVVDIDGNSYERTAIEDWLARNTTSPITRNPLQITDLRPNRALRTCIEIAVSAQAPPTIGGKKFLFVGNPGVGKSTLLNSVILDGLPPALKTPDKVFFKSGMAITGLTSILQSARILDPATNTHVEYLDTPGLADLERRKQAAEEITKALKLDGQYYIFFVISLQSGRIRPDDTTTMKLVLDSLKEHHTSLFFGIIINQLTPREMQMVESMKTFYLTKLNNGLPFTTDRLFLYPEVPTAVNEDNVVFDPLPEFKQFLWTVPPIDVQSNSVGTIKESEFEEIQAKLTASNQLLESDVNRMQAAIKQMEEENARKEKAAQDVIKRLQEEQQMRERMEAEHKAVQEAMRKEIELLQEAQREEDNRRMEAQREAENRRMQAQQQEAENRRLQAQQEEANRRMLAQQAEERKKREEEHKRKEEEERKKAETQYVTFERCSGCGGSGSLEGPRIPITGLLGYHTGAYQITRKPCTRCNGRGRFWVPC
jgi:hypothetical protein